MLHSLLVQSPNSPGALPPVRLRVMCRFLVIRAEAPFETPGLLTTFRRKCRDSDEYQGHGWGAAWRRAGHWSRHKSLTPIWEDVFELPEMVDFLIVHARSAFQDSGIAIENNMPFYRDELAFVFNGELRGVRLRVPGRIGAEKVFHLIEHAAEKSGDLPRALASTEELLLSKSDYVRALNVAVSDGERIYARCRYNESPSYFTLHVRDDAVRAVCSEPLDSAFKPMQNGQTVTL